MNLFPVYGKFGKEQSVGLFRNVKILFKDADKSSLASDEYFRGRKYGDALCLAVL